MALSRLMWFGTKQFSRWIKTHSPGSDYSMGGYSERLEYLNGGVGMRGSINGHAERTITWNTVTAREAREISDFAYGAYGDGTIYFLDPASMDQNALNKQWSMPALTGKDGVPLAGSVRPELVANSDQSYGYPSQMAKYNLGATDAARTFYVPVPPGCTAWVGVHGDPSSSLGLQVQPTVRGLSSAAPTVVPVGGVNSPTRVTNSFDAAADQGGIELSLEKRAPVTNLLTNPGFETGAGTAVVRTNANPNPRMYPAGTGWATTPTVATFTSTPNGVQIDVTAATTGSLLFNSADLAIANGDRWAASIEATVPAGFPATPLKLTAYAYGQNVAIADSGTVTVQPGTTVTLVAPSTGAATSAATGMRMIVYGGLGNAPAGARIVFRNALVEKALSPGPYFDGGAQPVLRTNLNPWGRRPVSWTMAAGVSIVAATDARFAALPQTVTATGSGWVAVGSYAVQAGDTHTVSFRHTLVSPMPATGIAGFGGSNPPAGTTTQGYTDNGDGTVTSWTTQTFSAAGSYSAVVNFTGAQTFILGDPMVEKGATPTGYFDGATVKPGFTYAWTGIVNASPAIETDSDLSVRWTSTANASASELFGVGIAGMGTGGGAAAIQSTRWVKSGTKSLRLIPTSATSNVSYALINFPAGVGAGGTVVITAHQEAPLTGPLWALRGIPYVNVGTVPSPSTTPNALATTEHRIVFPSGKSNVVLPHGGFVGSGDVWYDLATITSGTYTGPAFTGDSPGAAWNGAPHASTSTMSTFFSTIAGIVVQVLPTGILPDTGPFISGQGQGGMQFEGRVQATPYALAYDSFGLSVKLVETEG